MYENRAITLALNDASDAVYDVLTGQRQHPLIDDFLKALGSAGNQALKALEFQSSLAIPILPGDAYLVEAFVTTLYQKLTRASHSAIPSMDHLQVATGVGTVLFQLVVLRTYLDRGPCDDEMIYQLLRGTYQEPPSGGLQHKHTPRIVRRLTVPEEALAAVKGLGPSAGVEELWGSHIPQPSESLHRFIKCVKKLECRFALPLAYVVTEDNTLFCWPQSTDADPHKPAAAGLGVGLTSTTFPQNPTSSVSADLLRHSESPVRKPKPKPRPKARLLKRGRTGAVEREGLAMAIDPVEERLPTGTVEGVATAVEEERAGKGPRPGGEESKGVRRSKRTKITH